MDSPLSELLARRPAAKRPTFATCSMWMSLGWKYTPVKSCKRSTMPIFCKSMKAPLDVLESVFFLSFHSSFSPFTGECPLKFVGIARKRIARKERLSFLTIERETSEYLIYLFFIHIIFLKFYLIEIVQSVKVLRIKFITLLDQVEVYNYVL